MQPTSYSWSRSSDDVLLSPSGSSATACFAYTGATYSASITVTVSDGITTKSATANVTVT
jgi:hypothetical protein